MDWGLITVITAVAFLVGHLALDLRSLLRLTGRPHGDPAPDKLVLGTCDTCHAKLRGENELRHEAVWTVAAVVVLTGHIILDFVQ